MKVGLGSLEIRILESIARVVSDRPPFISELSKRFGVTVPVVSRAVSHLEREGLVSVERQGKRKMVALAGTPHALAFGELAAAKSHMEFESVLARSALRVLLGFRPEPTRIYDIARASSTPEVTVRRVVRKLAERAIVGRRKGTYFVILEGLREFIESYAMHIARVKAAGLGGSLIVRGAYMLLQTSHPDAPQRGFVETGIATFGRFGVRLFLTDKRDYFINTLDARTGEPDLETAVAHSLLRAKGLGGARELSYALLVLAKNEAKVDWARLEQRAADYSLSPQVHACKEYLEWQKHAVIPASVETDARFSERDGLVFPHPAEFKRLMQQYRGAREDIRTG